MLAEMGLTLPQAMLRPPVVEPPPVEASPPAEAAPSPRPVVAGAAPPAARPRPAPPPVEPPVSAAEPVPRTAAPPAARGRPVAAALSAADAASPPAPAWQAPADPAVAALDWPALRQAVAGCTACGLCEGRRHTVFGVGAQQAAWMVVGEAPGEQEDLQGEPFVGPAGQLLDNMLAAVGMSRQVPAAPADGQTASRSVYIANTLKCRPPRNRNPQPEELARCLPFLYRQIELVQPRLLLATGRFAVKALLGSDAPLGRLRGQVHHYQGIPVIVTYHPSYLLRQPTEKARAWEDLCLARSVIEGSSPREA